MISEFRNCWHVENATSAPIVPEGSFLPTNPGQIRRRGNQVILHYGPDRWLCVDNSAEQVEELQSVAQRSKIEITDVSGYWARIEFNDHSSFSVLGATQPVEFFLKDRDCAVMSLFDCPAIAVDGDEITMLLVRSSYAESFVQAFEKTRLAGDER